MLIIPGMSADRQVIEYGQIGPVMGREEAARIVLSPEWWLPELTDVPTLLRAFVGVMIAQDRASEVAKMLGPEGHKAPQAMAAVQEAIAEYLTSYQPDPRRASLFDEFCRVLRDRVAMAGWVLPWPAAAATYPQAPDAVSGSHWSAAIARHNRDWAHAAWAWRCGASGWLRGPVAGFEDRTQVPPQVTAAQSAAEAAERALVPDRATAAEMTTAGTRQRHADKQLRAALALRRRNSSRSGDAAYNAKMMRAGVFAFPRIATTRPDGGLYFERVNTRRPDPDDPPDGM